METRGGNTPLHIAAGENNQTELSHLLTHQQFNPNAQNKEGDTPLHIAIMNNQKLAISILSKYCDPNIQNKEDDTPLHIAVKHDLNEAVVQLFSNSHTKCNPTLRNREGCTPLHIAAGRNNITVVSYLLPYYDNPNTKNKEGDTPLHIACHNNFSGIIKHLLKRNCRTNIRNKKGETAQEIPLNEDGDYLLHLACQWGDVSIVKHLLTDQKCNPKIQNSCGVTPLHVAVKHECNEIIPQLLSCKECTANIVNREGDTPLHIAARENKTAALSQLVAHKQCDLNVQNKKGNTPLHIACHGNSSEIIVLLLERKCSTIIPNKRGETALEIRLNKDGDCLLHLACQRGDVGIIEYLIADQKCYPNVENLHMNTPLHIAVKHQHNVAIVQLLSCKECNPTLYNREGDTPLHIAVRKNNTAALSHLLVYQCDPNAQNKEGDTPLHIACRSDFSKIITLLLNRRGSVNVPKLLNPECDPNIQNKEGDTPLHIACRRNYYEVIRLLLNYKRRCRINIPNKRGETAQEIPLNKDGDCLLHIVCYWGDLDLIKYLVSDKRCNLNIGNSSMNTPLHNAVKYEQNEIISQLLPWKECNPTALNGDGDTPLHIAVRENKTVAFSQLLAHKHCNPNAQNKKGDTPLLIAVRNNQTAIISKLLACSQCDPNAQNQEGDTPLHIACRNNFLEIINLLLKRRCRVNVPNKKGKTAQAIPLNRNGDCLLHIVCQWGDVGLIKHLVTDKGCNPNIGNSCMNTPLHNAVMYEQNEIISQLLSWKECNPTVLNGDGDTPLHIAVRENKTVAFSQLLAHKHCNPNAQNKKGDTPLLIAVRNNQTAIISKLLACSQCDPNAQNQEGDTPLHIACHRKLSEVIRLLLKRGCRINVPNKKGETAQAIPLNRNGDCLLHIVCQWGDVGLIKQLVTDKGCNPNIGNSSMNTPLHNAVKYEQNEIILQLLDHEHCNPNAQNKEGDTPMHIACRNNFSEVVKLLLKRRCRINVPNKKGETAQVIPLNRNGDRLLHIVCQWGDVGLIKHLVTDKGCNPNIGNSCMNTPLHNAVMYEQNEIISQLLSWKECNPTVLNGDGDTPLHIAVRENKTVAFSQLLAHKHCNPNAQNKKGDTPLLIAVRNNQTAIISKLLACSQCDPNAQNKEGDTPLHIACHRKLSEVIRLLLKRGCRINVPNKKGETAQAIPLNRNGDCLLHIVCQWGDVGLIKHLVTDKGCNPNIGNSCMNTPLHNVVMYEQNEIISQLLSCEECNPNIFNREGDTPLHIAVREKKTAAISELVAHKRCDLNARNKKGDTPLHIAVAVKDLQLCELILNNDCCDVNALNEAHMTPLLVAIRKKIPSIATALLQHKCDLTLHDPDGNTALHLACIVGETQPKMVNIAKQLLTTADPSLVNSAGQTPIELTTNYELIQAIEHFTKCKTKHSVQTYIKIFIVGNPETGKSTLIEAIRYEAKWWWNYAPKRWRLIWNVPPHTAGIIPTTFCSKTFGNTVLYDLAGQTEYYTSHAAVIRTTVISTPPAFIVVVNMSESEEKISETLRYWWSFINNHAARASAPPQVILVGSHADKVEMSGGSVKEKMSQMSALLQDLPACFHFADQVALDCRDVASSELQRFCSIVKESCTKLRQTTDVDLHCHVLYAFLLEMFTSEIACIVSEIAAKIQASDALLPQNADNLIPLLSILSDKGLLLLIRESGNVSGNCWVIFKKQILLGEVNGAIFAPKHFIQHKDLSSSTGVVPSAKLKSEFPDYDPTMIANFLTHLEFCFKIDDHETLKLLKCEIVHEENMHESSKEAYYFFPALVSVENPLTVWEQNDDMACQSGWFYQCIQNDQHFTTQFLHALILRLAFSFALQLHPGDSREKSLALRRRCSVWKRGIGWLNREPIETIVEVGLLDQAVILMMRCPKGKEDECAQLRSAVIQKVIEAKDELCKAVEMSESFIHPSNIKYPFFDNTEDLKHYSLTEIAKATVKKKANVLDNRGRNPFPVKELLLFDSCNRQLLREMFCEKHSLDKEVRSQVMEELSEVTPRPAEPMERAQVEETSHEVLNGTSQYSGNTPTLPELLNFPGQKKRISIAQEIGTQYKTFGTILLEDDSGKRVDNIVHKFRDRAECINTEILQEWLTGRGKKPVTWETLVEVLRGIELSTLASDISTIKCPSNP